MFEITAHPAAKTALQEAHDLRGRALRRALARLFGRRRATPKAGICPAE